MSAYFFRSKPGASELRRLARRESGRVCQRVLMIANMLEGTEHEEAVGAVTSARFKERMVAGAALERDGVVAFRGVDAQRLLKEVFDIDCSLSSTYRLQHRIKLSWLAPRPRHPEADATVQAEFS
jgi:hypothetical protein